MYLHFIIYIENKFYPNNFNNIHKENILKLIPGE